MKFTYCKTYELEAIATLRYGTPTPEEYRPERDEVFKYPVFGTSGILGYFRKPLVKNPSPMIARKGNISGISYSEEPFWTVDTMFFLDVDRRYVLPKFLYCMFCTKNFVKLQEGNGIPSLRRTTLNKVEFKIPSLKEQQKFLDIIDPIDEKIFLNNQLIDALKIFGQSVVKKFSGNSVIRFEEVAGFVKGFAFPASQQTNKGFYKLLVVKNINDGFAEPDNLSKFKELSKGAKQDHILHSGDVVINFGGVVLGKVGIVFEDNLLLNQKIGKIVPKIPGALPFIYFFCLTPEFLETIQKFGHGTNNFAISLADIKGFKMPFSLSDVSAAGEKLVAPFNRIITCRKENVMLKDLREKIFAKYLR